MSISSSKRRLLQSIAASAAVLSVPGLGLKAAFAAGTPAPSGPWPTKPVRLLVGFPRDSAPDMAARAIAAPLSLALGQPVNVENKPGSSGNIVAAEVARATDDHTVGALINGNMTVAKMLNASTPFDPEKDFKPVGLIGAVPNVLLVNPGFPAKTLPELLALARQKGAHYQYASAGNGTLNHLLGEMLNSMAGISLEHVPYKGVAPAINDVLGG
ncbi:Bug family tripartite tricarboxylate transporter substrate binding protein, partial [Pseudomonas aeruginosa]|uniref:Bug family tripartite tricarboxylate transporter substrate binding protein n=1 Tax=Pseudomonas aeruginosa TaxID=287 RepID=UPI000A9A429A